MSELSYKPDWDRVVKAGKYLAVFCPEHPRSWSTGYVYVHTVVLESKLGRLLTDGEIVHHIDEDKKNNDPSNLEVTNRSDHARHHRPGRLMVELECPECVKVFSRPKNKTFLIKGGSFAACSNSCRGKVSWKLSNEDDFDLSGNVIREYRLDGV